MLHSEGSLLPALIVFAKPLACLQQCLGELQSGPEEKLCPAALGCKGEMLHHPFSFGQDQASVEICTAGEMAPKAPSVAAPSLAVLQARLEGTLSTPGMP